MPGTTVQTLAKRVWQRKKGIKNYTWRLRTAYTWRCESTFVLSLKLRTDYARRRITGLRDFGDDGTLLLMPYYSTVSSLGPSSHQTMPYIALSSSSSYTFKGH